MSDEEATHIPSAGMVDMKLVSGEQGYLVAQLTNAEVINN
jgi:hypothetical protein